MAARGFGEVSLAPLRLKAHLPIRADGQRTGSRDAARVALVLLHLLVVDPHEAVALGASAHEDLLAAKEHPVELAPRIDAERNDVHDGPFMPSGRSGSRVADRRSFGRRPLGPGVGAIR